MKSTGYWVNNSHIVFKDAIKPCKFCGFCPYGQLVEEFPVPSLSREAAIKRNEYMIKSLEEGLFDKMNPDHPDYMTKEDVITDIKEFDPNDYPEVAVPLDKMKCNIFGHHCPVYYHAELFCEEEQVTQEEIDIFEVEVNEYLEKITESGKRMKK